MHRMRIMDQNGDRALEWTMSDSESLERANAEFDRLVALGYLGSRMISQGQGEQIKSFDPHAQDIIMSAPIVAG